VGARVAFGLGWGAVRTGIAAVHRVAVECPDFLAEPKTVAVVGAPLTYGQPIDGVDTGPQALRDAGLKEVRSAWASRSAGRCDGGIFCVLVGAPEVGLASA
jgi:arginase